jgi:hypothetical protein
MFRLVYAMLSMSTIFTEDRMRKEGVHNPAFGNQKSVLS